MKPLKLLNNPKLYANYRSSSPFQNELTTRKRYTPTQANKSEHICLQKKGAIESIGVLQVVLLAVFGRGLENNQNYSFHSNVSRYLSRVTQNTKIIFTNYF